ncbi:retinal maintenance-domain-containing protein [Tribonema minus]|uniref:Cilia- and flagella-associated protein 418 n=1 Tax=Tribonema minus TaxID=303371 RepID=A0A836C8V7_9STRA|nr:retinal maintenance-domain-containing protein [Tribonema minus]
MDVALDDLLNEVEGAISCAGPSYTAGDRTRAFVGSNLLTASSYQSPTPQRRWESGSAASPPLPAKPRISASTHPRLDDIDSLLDLVKDDSLSPTRNAHSATAASGACAASSWRDCDAARASSGGSSAKRCGFPCIAGTSHAPGCAASSAGRAACGNLRCTGCDFAVLAFDSAEWDADVDYMFFRNNMPRRDRVATRLRARGGWRAYACQCSWRSVADVVRLGPQSDLRWVCGGH